ncbi:phosphate/phosphite/phosphonate ABC transporter substrate-binding protein [Thaumasiovibrio subtropicus]|uniref:phosphate/phosphite/phosphonate ABC transporter substrate-binding protein n=1 Tax=Thaumasiovibrio subtropicus TaxID=1891207 RepID=UPI000B361775|nr:phosphate/phosphite/phosphonate ABC transporter substrate-binding protein [Thaumasiovibrio subtropicus]
MIAKRRNRLTRPWIVAVLVAWSFAFAVQAKDEQVLTFGIVPQQSAAKLAQQWTPLINAWSELTGLQMQFATAPDIPTFEQRLADGEYDLAYMNPYHFTLFSQAPGYHAVANAKNKRITGIIVAHRDWQGPLDDLQQAQIAFPAPRAFAATLLTQAELGQSDIRFTPRYVGSHDSVYLAVAKGIFPAGGGIMRTFNSIPETLKSRLKVIHRTASYTPHAIAIHPKHSEEMRMALVQVIDLLNEHHHAAAAFEMLNIQGLQAAQNEDWNDVLALGISK